MESYLGDACGSLEPHQQELLRASVYDHAQNTKVGLIASIYAHKGTVPDHNTLIREAKTGDLPLELDEKYVQLMREYITNTKIGIVASTTQ